MEEDSRLKRWLKALRLNEAKISTILGALVVVLVGILVYNYFSSVNRPKELTEETVSGLKLVEEEGQLVPENLPTVHVVSASEHLWMIAEKYYGSGYNWVDIARENNLVNANLLYVDQKLVIPRVPVKMLTAAGAVSEPTISGTEYTVVKGDSLWKIAVQAYADGYRWTEIWQANKDKIQDPNLIEIGQALTLPR
jgi:nucleoid-associated protein YgaU